MRLQRQIQHAVGQLVNHCRCFFQGEKHTTKSCTWPLQPVLSAQTLVHQTAQSGPLGRDRETRASSCLRDRSVPDHSVVRLAVCWDRSVLESWRLTARRRSSAGPLGLSALRVQPVRCGDTRQTPTALGHLSDGLIGRVAVASGGCFRFSSV